MTMTVRLFYGHQPLQGALMSDSPIWLAATGEAL
jgi:hypothetical protein